MENEDIHIVRGGDCSYKKNYVGKAKEVIRRNEEARGERRHCKKAVELLDVPSRNTFLM